MKQIFLQVFSLCGLITWLVSCQQGAAPVNTALTVYRVFDSTRLFDTTVPRHDGRYYRPVKIDFYYPSTDVPGKSPMSYGAILEMYEQRLGYDLPEDSCKKVAVELAKMFGDYLHVPADKLMSYKNRRV